MSSKFIILIGHPNSGKTTLFNHLTKSRHKTVNYPGSTVDFALGKWGPHTLCDTPGIRSLIPNSEDEKISLSSLFHLNKLIPSAPQYPDLVLIVLDLARLEVQLPLARQLSDAGFNCQIVINKTDLEGKQVAPYNKAILENAFQVPVHFVSSKQKDFPVLAVAVAQTKPLTSPPKNTFKNLTEADFKWSQSLINQTFESQQTPALPFDLDRIILHPIWGLAIFVAIMAFVFWIVFAAATPFIDGIDSGIGWLITFLKTTLPNTLPTQLLTDGLISGLGSVLVFVPQIFLLFISISILESSGFLARGAVIIDKPLSWIGLNGRSFVPLLSGCACAIPAMMAARTIPQKKQRLLTMFIIPLMSCSARLPVYGLLIALLVGANALKSGLMMTGIYFASFMFASIVAAIAGKLLRIEKSSADFHIELPPWHIPDVRSIMLHAWDQTLSFCKQAGPTIAFLGIIIWGLQQFPNPDNAYISDIAMWIEPLLTPLGVDGRVGVALLLAFAAREVFVSTLVLIFIGSTSGTTSLVSVLQEATFQGTDTLIFTTPTIIGLIIFFMISMQCISTIAVAKKEMLGWKLPIIMTTTYIVLAYGLAIAGLHLTKLILH